MEHETAIQVRAAERYCSGELSPRERDEFEEHYFSCAECAEEVRWEQIFAANSKALFQEEAGRQTVGASGPAKEASGRKGGGWRKLLKMQLPLLLSVVTNVVLVGALGYHLLRVVPAVQKELAENTTPQLSSAIAAPTVVRGEDKAFAVSAKTRLVPLSFVSPRPFPQYAYDITAENSGLRLSGSLAAPDKIQEELLLSIPTGKLKADKYLVVLIGIEGGSRAEIGRCRFEILN